MVIKQLRQYGSILIAVIAAVGYGGITRIAFGQRTDIFGTFSISFLCFTPLALGALTVLFASVQQRSSIAYVIFAPWLSCTICILIAAVFMLEAWFCVLLALPLFWGLSSVGGMLARGILAIVREIRGSYFIVLLLFTSAPYLFAPIENHLPLQDSMRTVHSQVEIKASPQVIWRNITNLREITAPEKRFAVFHLVGLPRPIEARMSCESVGCVRRGQWEDSLAFEGTLTDIQPNKFYSVNLKADTRNVVSAMVPLTEIGGKYFDMVDDSYDIQSLDDNTVILHLYSTYRLTTRINAYASLWTDFLMRDIQNYILQVEKMRCERGVN